MNEVEDDDQEANEWAPGWRWRHAGCAAAMLEVFSLPVQDPTALSHLTTSSCVKILPKGWAQQRCDLTLYYTGLYTSTSRMQRCPLLKVWFSAARASFPRDHSAVRVRYMETAGLRRRRSARAETGLRSRERRSQTHLSEPSSLPHVHLCPRCWRWLAVGRLHASQAGLKKRKKGNTSLIQSGVRKKIWAVRREREREKMKID